jgi:hypothetical protein
MEQNTEFIHVSHDCSYLIVAFMGICIAIAFHVVSRKCQLTHFHAILFVLCSRSTIFAMIHGRPGQECPSHVVGTMPRPSWSTEFAFTFRTATSLAWLDYYDLSTDAWVTEVLPDAPHPRDHTGGAYLPTTNQFLSPAVEMVEPLTFFDHVILPTLF